MVTPDLRPLPHGPDALDRLRELVEADPRPLGEIAAAAGISPAHFSQVRSGHRANPSVATVAAILAALSRSWADLDG